MNDEQGIDPAAALLDPHGNQARSSAADTCPQCGKGPEVRRPSGGFGQPWTVCGGCGYEWKDRVFRG